MERRPAKFAVLDAQSSTVKLNQFTGHAETYALPRHTLIDTYPASDHLRPLRSRDTRAVILDHDVQG